MMLEHSSNHKAVMIIVAAFVLVVGLYLLIGNQDVDSEPVNETPLSENMSGLPEGWVTLQYPPVTLGVPERLTGTYIGAIEWPPEVEERKGVLACTPIEAEDGSAIPVETKMIQGSTYCVSEQTVGAAGNLYTTHIYTFQSGASIITLSFTTRSIQCQNFDEEEGRQCAEEQAAFNLDALIDQIAKTVSVRPVE